MSLLCVLLLYYVKTAVAEKMMLTGVAADIGYSSEIAPNTPVSGSGNQDPEGNDKYSGKKDTEAGGFDHVDVNENGNYDKLLQIADYLRKKDAALGNRALKLVAGRMADGADSADISFNADLLSIEKMNGQEIAAIAPIALKIGNDGLSKISSMSSNGITPDELFEIITMLDTKLPKSDFVKITGIFLDKLDQ